MHPSLDFGPATEFDLIVRPGRLPSPQACARWSGISKHAPMGLASRPFSACATGKLRDLTAERGLRRIPCRSALTPSDPVKDLQESVRPCLTRTSMRPQVFTTSRRLALSDASQAYFSSVALLGFTPFRGFSSLVAGVVGLGNRIRLSLSRLPAHLDWFRGDPLLLLSNCSVPSLLSKIGMPPGPLPEGTRPDDRISASPFEVACPSWRWHCLGDVSSCEESATCFACLQGFALPENSFCRRPW